MLLVKTFEFSDSILFAPKSQIFEPLEGILVGINNKLYKKLRGRAYRTYYICIKKNCEGQVMVNDLQGGVVTEIKPHTVTCENYLSKSS